MEINRNSSIKKSDAARLGDIYSVAFKNTLINIATIDLVTEDVTIINAAKGHFTEEPLPNGWNYDDFIDFFKRNTFPEDIEDKDFSLDTLRKYPLGNYYSFRCRFKYNFENPLEPLTEENYKQLVVKCETVEFNGHKSAVFTTTDITRPLRIEHQNEMLLEENIRHLEIANALCDEYTSVYHVNTKSKRFTIFRLAPQMEADYGKTLRKKISFEKVMELYLNDKVVLEDQEEFRYLTNIDYIKNALKTRPMLRFNYRAVWNGTRHYYQMKIVRTDSDVSSFVVGFSEKDDEIKRETDYRNRLKEAKKRAEQANLAKSNFLFDMSHDIRTPMNAIIGYNAIALKYLNDPEKLEDCLNKSASAANHLLELVNEVLDMARIESGKVEIKETPVNILEIFEEVAIIFQNEAKLNNISFSTSNVVNDKYIYMDALHTKQIFINILSNAVKYTKSDGNINFDIVQLPCDEVGYAKFETHIKDNGIGMSKDFQKHLFENFTRAKNSTVSGIQGYGLGLSIAKRLLDLMNGTIEIKSQYNKGTEVIITMTFKIQNAPEIRKEKKKVNLDDFKGKRILMAEDNELNREIAEEILRDFGFEVDSVENGVNCLEQICSTKPGYYDLILMDIQMPYMDGYKATKIIRSLPTEEYSSIPIIAMTANAFEEDRQKALQAGMNEHIAKPINVPLLQETLHRFIVSK